MAAYHCPVIVVFVTATLNVAEAPAESTTTKSHVPPGMLEAAPGVTENVVAPCDGDMLAAAAPFACVVHVDSAEIENVPAYPFSLTVNDCDAALGLVKIKQLGINENVALCEEHANGVAEGIGVGLAVGLGVGDAVGLGVGDAVGLGVGDAVGLGVGDAVGLGVGDAVGLGVGDAVGLGVGDAVGFGVGDAVSVGVADAVGVAVGPLVGVAVGPLVGVAVGPLVGVAVGPLVGAAVGTPVGVTVGLPVGLAVACDDFGVSVLSPPLHEASASVMRTNSGDRRPKRMEAPMDASGGTFSRCAGRCSNEGNVTVRR